MKSAFTLVELLVVVGMIALLTGAVGTSVSESRARARVAKAQAEVKEMTNAILGYEQFARAHNLDVPELDVDANDNDLKFILGKAGDVDGVKIPVFYNGAVGGDGMLRDPWGRPYHVKIVAGQVPAINAGVPVETGYYLPNIYRLSAEEGAQ